MLTEQRYEVILSLLKEKKSVTVTQLKEVLNTSESTVRRDITALHNAGRLCKVFGGAVAVGSNYVQTEPTVAQKEEINREEKTLIARIAASFIEPGDFVYIDAGTTTGCMLPFITEHGASYVTNAVAHGKYLAAQGFKVYLVGGELKAVTEAIVGNPAVVHLQSYHFTKGFFGTNGITRSVGYSTPDMNEGQVKKVAFKQCLKPYILADGSKFDTVCAITFGAFSDATVLTDSCPGEYADCSNVVICRE